MRILTFASLQWYFSNVETYPGHVLCTVAIVILCLFVMVVMLYKSTVSTPKLCHKWTENPCRNVIDPVEPASC